MKMFTKLFLNILNYCFVSMFTFNFCPLTGARHLQEAGERPEEHLRVPGGQDGEGGHNR